MGKYFSSEQVSAILEENGITDGQGVQAMFKEVFKEFFEAAFKAELKNELGYSKYKRRLDKNDTNSRNGYSTKKVKTDSAGEVELNIPRDREGKYEPQIIKKHETDISSMEDKVLSMFAKGMSTNAISTHMSDIYGFGVSAEQVSRVTDKILPIIKEWQNRPLSNIYTILFLDGMVFNVKENGVYKKKTAYIVMGINIEGMKDILGIWISNSESSKFWMSVLSDIRERGTEDVLIASVDGLPGFEEAIKAIFPKTDIQKCIVHQIRNSCKYVTHTDRREFCKDMKPIYRAINKEQGFSALEEFKKKWNSKYAHSVRSWYKNWDTLSTFFKYPAEIRRVIYTTNAIESYNNGIKRITKTKTCFQSDESLTKMIYLITQDLRKKWRKPIPNWGLIYHQIMIHFKDRLPENI